MKRSQLKSLIKEIIRETLTTRSDLDLGVMKAVNVEETISTHHIGQGFFKIDGVTASKLSNGKMSKFGFGYEMLVPAPAGFKTAKGFVWLSRRADGGQMVWTIRDSKNWVLKDGRAVLSPTEEQTGTGAVAGYQTPFAFSRKGSGSKRALDVTTKMGYTKVGEAPRV